MMKPLENALRLELLNALGSAAAYNDKGVTWYGHDAAEVEAMQLGFQRDQLELAREIGAAILGAELMSAIESGAASRDGSGNYASLAEKVLGIRRVLPTGR